MINNEDYIATVDLGGEYLEHHGVKGMKWGVRRYQNEDGSLTPQGLKRRKKILDNPKLLRKHVNDDMWKFTSEEIHGAAEKHLAINELERAASYTKKKEALQKKQEKIEQKKIKQQEKQLQEKRGSSKFTKKQQAILNGTYADIEKNLSQFSPDQMEAVKNLLEVKKELSKQKTENFKKLISTPADMMNIGSKYLDAMSKLRSSYTDMKNDYNNPEAFTWAEKHGIFLSDNPEMAKKINQQMKLMNWMYEGSQKRSSYRSK